MNDAGITVDVVWAPLTLANPHFAGVLDEVELARRQAYRRHDDADRFLLGATMVRCVVAARLGIAPEKVRVNRRCPSCGTHHGRVRVPGAGLHLSVTHAGGMVGVATCADAPVGLDIEPLDQSFDSAALAATVLAPREIAVFKTTPPAAQMRTFLRYWTRKEAVVKSTGDGLKAGLTNVLVSAPHEVPTLLEWQGRPNLAQAIRLLDLEVAPTYLAALAVVDRRPVLVNAYGAEGLLCL